MGYRKKRTLQDFKDNYIRRLILAGGVYVEWNVGEDTYSDSVSYNKENPKTSVLIQCLRKLSKIENKKIFLT